MHDRLPTFWFALSFLPAESLVPVAQAAERAGFDGLLISDHLGRPLALRSHYPHGRGRRTAIPAHLEWPDPLAVAAALAMTTERVRVATHVVVAPLWPAPLLARAAMSIATLSGNRFELGLGAGWMREEFDALDIPFDDRHDALDALIPMLRESLCGRPLVDRHGETRPVVLSPVPDRLPILTGGEGGRAIRRAGSLADGFAGVDYAVDALESLVRDLTRARHVAGRADEPFEIRVGIRGPLDISSCRTASRAGVTSIVVSPWRVCPDDRDPRALFDALPRFAEQVLEPIRAALR